MIAPKKTQQVSLSRLLSPAGTVGLYTIYAVLLLVFVVPFIWMIFGSLRNEREIFEFIYPLQWHTIIPQEWTLKNFLDIFGLSPEGQSFGLNFGRGFLNSLIMAGGVVVCSLIFNTMGAYFFARLDFPAKNALFLFAIATMLVPFEATIVPLYIVVRTLRLQDTYLSLIVPWFASPFIIFALRQFFAEIPKDLDEAATIDGASQWQILRHIIVPNSLPGLVTMALAEFQFVWNQFYWPLIAVSDQNIQVLQVLIQQQTTQAQVYWGRTFAGCVLASVPIIIVFLYLQRYYVRGIVLSGIKG